MSGERQEIFPDRINEVICEGCSKKNKVVIKEGVRQYFAFTCACGTTTSYAVVNRRRSKRQFSSAFGTCWLEDNERGITIKIEDISDDGLKIEFMGRKSELAPKIITTGKGKVIYNEGGRIISQPREVIFKNMNGLKVGAEFVEEDRDDKDKPVDRAESGDAEEANRENENRKDAPPGRPSESDNRKSVKITCKACGNGIIAKAGFDKTTRITCPECGNVFNVKMERRRASRSNVAYPGQIADLTGEKYNVNVQNLSDDGICFSLLDEGLDDFNESEHLIVSFNKADEVISGKAIIISFSEDKRIHARFKIYKT